MPLPPVAGMLPLPPMGGKWLALVLSIESKKDCSDCDAIGGNTCKEASAGNHCMEWDGNWVVMMPVGSAGLANTLEPGAAKFDKCIDSQTHVRRRMCIHTIQTPGHGQDD